MKASYLIIGALFIIGPFFFAKDELINLKVQNEGQNISTPILSRTNHGFGTNNYFIKVKPENDIISHRVSSGFYEKHMTGDTVEVKYLKGYDRILLTEENITTEFISIALLALFGLYVIYLGLKKPRQNSNLIKK